ncbi:RNA polymerase sigma factor [Paenibacillus sp. MWE-103]|uniref:RNA polymerase sigma factor n=1 Tax=Paenibacillus artemisiicola TaxID=1172618 RepID=A0ABS3WAB3_9BACL|nr:RNA polymerase sigma factor [Paenibacillus artemisiicola]MBO7745091.1 RNA polymerase sigma factor [Paenibacillus artemisiicola]
MEVNAGNEWIESLIDRYYDSVYRYCYHMLRQRQDAEDASQEIFVKTLKSRNVQHQIQSEAAWIYRVAHNHCLNILKKRKLLQLLPFVPGRSGDSFQDAALAHVESSLDIDRLLSRLSSEERSIMVLRVIEDRAFEEIGAIIHHSAATARKKFERAKRKLQKSLQSGNGGQEHEQATVSYI